MMINIAQPLFVKADSTDIYIDTGNGTHPYASIFNSDESLSRAYNQSYINGNQYYLYLSFMSSYNNNGFDTGGAFLIVWNNQPTTFENNTLSIQYDSNTTQTISCIVDVGGALPRYDYNLTGGSFTSFSFNFDTFDSSSNLGTLETFFNNIFNTTGITYTYYEIRTNYPININTGLNIDVSFTPALSGDVDRTINGRVYDSFDINIDNHCNFGVQVFMAIVPHSGSIEFYDRTDHYQDEMVSGAININSSNYKFIWWSSETNYNYDSLIQTDGSYAHHHHPVSSEVFTATKQISATPWHYVPANQSGYVHRFDRSQIPLDEYNSYDVLVYAVRNDYGYASRQAAFPNGDYFIDYDDIECVYESTFKLTNGYKFDINNRNHGNYIVDDGSKAINYGLSSIGTFDENDNVIIEERGIDQFIKNYDKIMSDYQESRVSHNFSGYSSTDTSFDQVDNTINPFMRFIKYTFDYLPDGIQVTFYIGFTAVVVLAIIRKVFI